MAVLKNRVGVATSTVGTGNLALGAPLGLVSLNTASWQDFSAAGVTNGNTVRYLILDATGEWEYGPGIYSTSGPSLTRAVGSMSGSVAGQKSSTGALLNLSGAAQVFIAAVAEDLVPFDSPVFIGNPQAPTPSPGDNDTSIATTAFVQNAISSTPIPDGSVTDAKLADMPSPTFKARVTAGTGDPENITPIQATAQLSLFTSILKGLVPGSGGGTSNFLRADGSWVAPPSGGGGGASVSISDTPPGSPAAGDMWWESDTGTLWIYYNDGTSSQWVVAAGGSASPAAPQRTVLTSGSGTYTTPTGATWLEAELVGGGGGGSGGGSAPPAAGNGGNTTFGTLTANGGAAGAQALGGIGGTASGGDINASGGGGDGGGAVNDATTVLVKTGGVGGASYYGGGGRSGYNAAGGNGLAPGSGGGGGGSGLNTSNPGGGGAAGAYCKKLIAPPAASYAYSVGAAGTAGAAASGGLAGGAGGSGQIVVTAHFGG